ncbi:MAG: alkaline phosphatase family protein [Rhizomicrobium sp.]
MRFVRLACAAVLGALLVTPAAAKPAHRPAPAAATPATPQARNVIVFVADGLRYSSVTQETAPTLFALRQGGVDFSNSHAIYPTVTTANASAIATATISATPATMPTRCGSIFPSPPRAARPSPSWKTTRCWPRVKAHYPDDYMAETSLLAAARAAGMNTAVIGKLGPAGIQDVTAFDGKSTIVIDDATNRARNADGTASGGVPLPRGFGGQISQATALDASPLSAVPNFVQQSYLTTATTEVVLPYLKDQHKPFALLYWSRDPDGTQHSQLDSDGHLLPGINGPTGHDGIRNADNALRALLHKLDDLGLRSAPTSSSPPITASRPSRTACPTPTAACSPRRSLPASSPSTSRAGSASPCSIPTPT